MIRSSVPCTTTTGTSHAAHWSSTERSPGHASHLRPDQGLAGRCRGPIPRGPRSAWSSAPRAPAGRRRSRGSRDSRAARSTGCSGPSPRRRPVSSPQRSNDACRSGGNGARSRIAGAIATQAATRSGWSDARSSACRLPIDSATTTARSVPVASSTSSASCVCCSRAYAELSSGRSEAPLPRGSKVITRVRRARNGDLQLPDLGRHDAPGREQQHRRVLRPGQVAVHLPGDAYAVALDETRRVGLSCLHALSPEVQHPPHQRFTPWPATWRTGQYSDAPRIGPGRPSGSWTTSSGTFAHIRVRRDSGGQAGSAAAGPAAGPPPDRRRATPRAAPRSRRRRRTSRPGRRSRPSPRAARRSADVVEPVEVLGGEGQPQVARVVLRRARPRSARSRGSTSAG